jgi:hypothetical protein
MIITLINVKNFQYYGIQAKIVGGVTEQNFLALEFVVKVNILLPVTKKRIPVPCTRTRLSSMAGPFTYRENKNISP